MFNANTTYKLLSYVLISHMNPWLNSNIAGELLPQSSVRVSGGEVWAIRLHQLALLLIWLCTRDTYTYLNTHTHKPLCIHQRRFMSYSCTVLCELSPCVNLVYSVKYSLKNTWRPQPLHCCPQTVMRRQSHLFISSRQSVAKKKLLILGWHALKALQSRGRRY